MKLTLIVNNLTLQLNGIFGCVEFASDNHILIKLYNSQKSEYVNTWLAHINCLNDKVINYMEDDNQPYFIINLNECQFKLES